MLKLIMWSVTGLLPQYDWSLFWGSRDSHTVKAMSGFFWVFLPQPNWKCLYSENHSPEEKKNVDLWQSSPSSCCWFVSFLKQFSGSLNGKPHFFSLNVLLVVCCGVCVCVWYFLLEKRTAFWEAIWWLALSALAPIMKTRDAFPSKDAISDSSGPTVSFKRWVRITSERGAGGEGGYWHVNQGILWTEWRGGRGSVKHAMRPADPQSACNRKHMGVVRARTAEVHECTLLLFSPQMRPLPVTNPCLLPLHTVIAWQTNSAKVCASKPRNCLSARTKTSSLISFNTWPGHSIGLIYLINGWAMSALGIQLSKLDSLWMITNKKPPFLTTGRFVFQFHTLLQWL